MRAVNHSSLTASTINDARSVKLLRMGTIGQRLREVRQAAGLTLEQAGAVSGVSKQGISQIERGVTKNPEAATLEPLCRRLGVNLQWLMSGRGPRLLNPSSSPALTTGEREPASQPTTLDPDTLHEALTLLLFDEEVAGPYPPRAQSRRLAELYGRVAADGGKLTDAHNDAFVTEVQARGSHVAANQPPARRRRAHG